MNIYKLIIGLSLSSLLFSCNENKETTNIKIISTHENGQTKISHQPFGNDGNAYYEITYDNSGKIKRIATFIDGKMNGAKVYFDSLEVVAITYYENDLREGTNYEFYDKHEIVFKGGNKNGKFHGTSSWYYADAMLIETGERFEDKKIGDWVEYHENGQLAGKGTYIDNEKADDWKYWDEDGKEASIEELRNRK